MASATDRDASPRERLAEHEGFLVHRRMRWAKLAALLCLAVLAGYVLSDVRPRPNGGSWYGYTLGTIGALLIVWLALLGIRKRAMTPGRWSLKAWTSAHVYLGLALIFIVTLHSSFQFGWNVHTLAYALMMLVILSGVYGVVAYAGLPRALSANRGETTQEEMVEALASIDRQLDQAAQSLGREETDLVIAALEEDVFSAGLLRRLAGDRFRGSTRTALERFGDAHGIGDERVRSLLSRRQAQLDRVRRHMRIRARLEIWLYIHVPMTFALLAALTAHVVSVFYYW